MTIEEIVDKHYDQIFREILAMPDDSLFELLIEVKIGVDGKTIRRSWKDRNEMLREE